MSNVGDCMKGIRGGIMGDRLKRQFWGYLGRFSLVHVVTYLTAGLIFMNLQNYAEVFAVSEGFANFRSLEF